MLRIYVVKNICGETLSCSFHVNMLCSSLTRVLGDFDFAQDYLLYWGPNVATSLMNKLFVIRKKLSELTLTLVIYTFSKFTDC